MDKVKLLTRCGCSRYVEIPRRDREVVIVLIPLEWIFKESLDPVATALDRRRFEYQGQVETSATGMVRVFEEVGQLYV